MAGLPRTTARVVPVSPDGACLLLLERDPARPSEPWWGTIGGAADPEETLAEAAVRELREETGVVVTASDLTAPIRRVHSEFSWNGTAYVGDSTVFALRLERTTPISFAHLEPEEIGNVLDARWLMPEEAAHEPRLMWPDLPDIMVAAVAAVAAVEGQQ